MDKVIELVQNRPATRWETWWSEWLCIIDAVMGIITFGFLGTSLVLDYYMYIGVFKVKDDGEDEDINKGS